MPQFLIDYSAYITLGLMAAVTFGVWLWNQQGKRITKLETELTDLKDQLKAERESDIAASQERAEGMRLERSRKDKEIWEAIRAVGESCRLQHSQHHKDNQPFIDSMNTFQGEVRARLDGIEQTLREK